MGVRLIEVRLEMGFSLSIIPLCAVTNLPLIIMARASGRNALWTVRRMFFAEDSCTYGGLPGGPGITNHLGFSRAKNFCGKFCYSSFVVANKIVVTFHPVFRCNTMTSKPRNAMFLSSKFDAAKWALTGTYLSIVLGSASLPLTFNLS